MFEDDRCPELSPRLRADLAAHNPLGIPLTPEDVSAWWEWIWSKFKGYRYRNRERAVRSWWHRVREADVDAARARRKRIAEEAELDRLESLQRELNQQERLPSDNVFRLVCRRGGR